MTGFSAWEARQEEHALLGALPKTLPELPSSTDFSRIRSILEP